MSHLRLRHSPETPEGPTPAPADWRIGTVTALAAVWVVVFDNGAFWRVVLSDFPLGWDQLPFLAAVFAVLVGGLGALLSLLGFRPVFKPALVGVLLVASVTAYFMDTYGTLIDRTMLQNVFETDVAETAELLGPRLVARVALFGILPSVGIWWLALRYLPPRRAALAGARRALAFAALGGIAVGAFYPSFAVLGRNHREIRYLLNPSNVIHALVSQTKHALRGAPPRVAPVGEDARRVVYKGGRDRPTLVVLVVGEAARASEFSIFGYERPTTPRLARLDTLNFSRVRACGTSTAVSLPCMFLRTGRAAYRDGLAKREESLLDVLTHAGVSVRWRDNNSGCKGVCKRVPTERVRDLRVPGLCNEETCYDEVLIHGLQDLVDGLPGDGLIVLHQKGSHGPAYHARVPPRFEVYRPVCRTNQLQRCERQAVVNAYDNTILYTDYVLSRLVEVLDHNRARFRTAMIYVSDHGESLGEKNLYLHGLPYFVAPDEQTRVPMILWLSPEIERATGVDRACLRARQDAELSHDYLFHTVLGLMGVVARVYDPQLDLMGACRTPTRRADPLGEAADPVPAGASHPGAGSAGPASAG